jgi:PPM family protein phosphatase
VWRGGIERVVRGGAVPVTRLDSHLRSGLTLHDVDDDLMPIGEFSERSGLSPKRLRSYAAAGLLVPAAIDSSSGYRYYSPGQLREARLIDALRIAGVPLAEIEPVLRDQAPERLDAWARQVEVDAAQRHDALNLARRLLAFDVDTAATGTADHSRKEAMTSLQAAARTDIGRVRDSNEDAVLCLDHLVAVADGMGGHPGGEVASKLALSLLGAAFTGDSLTELEAAVRAANRAIAERAAASTDLEGMGTTLCAIGVIGDGRLAVVNVGDSRAYVMRDDSLRQLTDDHSITGELIRRGELTEQEAISHPHRSVLTRALGCGPEVDVDGALHPAAEGDRILLCTDGLFNEVAEDDILSLMGGAQEVEPVADALVEQALSHGGRDNITVVVAEVRG